MASRWRSSFITSSSPKSPVDGRIAICLVVVLIVFNSGMQQPQLLRSGSCASHSVQLCDSRHNHVCRFECGATTRPQAGASTAPVFTVKDDQPLWDTLSWSFNVMASDRFPALDPFGELWKDHDRSTKAGTKLSPGGEIGVFCQFAEGW